MRIVFLQYGDFREAAEHFDRGGQEYYHDQRFTVDFVNDLARRAEYVGVYSLAPEPYDVQLPSGVHTLGIAAKGFEDRAFTRALARAAPSVAIPRVPTLRVLRWLRRNGVRSLPLFADTFSDTGRWTRRLRYRGIVRELRHPFFEWVANHNVPAARSLADSGVQPGKVVAYDYESRWEQRPALQAAKTAPRPGAPVRIAFVGHLSEAKGLPECIEAVRHLADAGIDARLTVAGKGEQERFSRQAAASGVSERVDFLGRIDHERVTPLMREHDVVVVASRTQSAEGMPGTIYEALCSRTPLVLSDHPSFQARLQEPDDVLYFRSPDAASLAARIRELVSDARLYARLSGGADEAWQKLQCPTGWAELITRFLRNEAEDRRWLAGRSLAAAGAAPQ